MWQGILKTFSFLGWTRQGLNQRRRKLAWNQVLLLRPCLCKMCVPSYCSFIYGLWNLRGSRLLTSPWSEERTKLAGWDEMRWEATRGTPSRLAVHPSLPRRPTSPAAGEAGTAAPGDETPHTPARGPGQIPPRSRVASAPFRLIGAVTDPSLSPCPPAPPPSVRSRRHRHPSAARPPPTRRSPLFPFPRGPPVGRSGSHVFHATRVASPTGGVPLPAVPTARSPSHLPSPWHALLKGQRPFARGGKVHESLSEAVCLCDW